MKFSYTLLILSLFFSCSLQSRILNVPDNYSTIQSAINAAAQHNDTILVSPGNYSNIVVNSKSLVIASLFLTTQDESYIDQTVINGSYDHSAVKLASYGDELPVKLIGFTIKNGHKLYNSSGGGGILVWYNKVELSHLKIKDNFSNSNGGGMYIKESDVTLNYCEFNNNEAPGLIVNNEFRASYGGAICCSSSNPHTLTANHCDFIDNYAYKGAAVYGSTWLSSHTNTHFFECNFIDNESRKYSGAVYLRGDSATIERCVFQDNTCYEGGAIIAYPIVYFLLDNCLVSGNSGALELYSQKIVISNSTITDNGCIHKPIYICCESKAYVFNSIVWNICGKEFELGNDNQLHVSYSTIQNDTSSVLITDNYNKVVWYSGISGFYPVFSGWEDYHLKPESPCIGAGTDSIKMNEQWFYSPIVDLDDSLRPNPTGTPPDIGAYENELGLPVSIHNNQVSEITLYPNPAKDRLYFQNSSGSKITYYAIVDLSGKTVMKGRVTENKITVSGLTAGVYMVAVKTDKEIIKKKLVILN